MEFLIKPLISLMETAKEFKETCKITDKDLILTNRFIYEGFFKDSLAKVVYYEDYGAGEPTDVLVEGIYKDIRNYDYGRVIAIGGGAIIDVGKLLALRNISPVVDLFEGRLEVKRDKELIIVPTTCGTGSEVTHISILSLTARGTKYGLQNSELYADKAVMIPELLKTLPYKVFATSSIDALIHAFESFTSPRATEYSRMFSLKAIQSILYAYKYISEHGPDSRGKFMWELLMASNYAGIAFSNAGCAAVHAMSYPLGAKYHVPHGESNYVLFMAVYKAYLRMKPFGIIQELNKYLADILECDKDEVYVKMDALLEAILPLRKMHEYGATEKDLEEFTKVVLEKQTRLTRNNYVELTKSDYLEIYRKVF